MKSSKINYVLVGGFVLAMVAGLVVTIAKLQGRTVGATDEYFTYYEDTTGLKFGSQVLYMGYLVGQVEEVVPDAEHEPGRLLFRVRMSVTDKLQDWKVPADSYAKITAAGLLAPTVIDIRAGESSEVLEPGGVITGVGQTDLFAALSDVANIAKGIGEQIEPIVTKIDTFATALEANGEPILTDIRAFSGALRENREVVANVSGAFERLNAFLTTENAEGARNTVANVEAASENLLELSKEARRDLDALMGPEITDRVAVIVDNVEVASGNLRNVLRPETGPKLRRALDNISAAARNVAILTRDLRSTRQHIDDLMIALKGVVAENRPDVRESVRHLRYTLSTVAQHIDALTQNLEGTSRNMYEFSRQIRANPGVLLRGATPTDDAVPAARRRPQ